MIATFDPLRTLPQIEADIRTATDRVLHSGHLILGPETAAFEEEFARWIGAKHCVSTSSGTTALHLALWALGIGPGDEVITVANTCVPTVAAIRLTGATPVFADVCEDDLTIDPSSLTARITRRTQCIVPVHLWGHAARMQQITQLAAEADIPVVEDCAQAHGTLLDNKSVGTFGTAGCFSFYPTKNLGTFGEGGAVVTSSRKLAERLRSMRMYGYDEERIAQREGMNARINELQAAYLRVKLPLLDKWIACRRTLAEIYDTHLLRSSVMIPENIPGSSSSYHQYVIRLQHRDRLRAELAKREIGTGIHYPTPVHHMPAYQQFADELPITEQACGEILSLPIHEGLTETEVRRVADAIRQILEQ